MNTLRLYNSLTKQLEEFKPAQPGKVGIYNCGPTVYKRQHIGNMRRFLFSDFLRRTLELFGYEVRDVTNITDVGHLTQDDINAGEDKLEREAREQQKTPQEIAEAQTKQFVADLQALNIEPAHVYPRATAHIKQMHDIVAKLLESGHAYQTDSGIYYDVQSFPDYGKLSGNTLEAIEAGARVEVRGDKKHPADFALWIFDNSRQIQRWESPWGEGYPGWHIECSAMSMKYLDVPIDIHTGGEDNKFPHHENEIAQSEGLLGKPFVKYWMHNSHLQLAGAKLAKREGQQITLDTVRDEGFSPLAFRLLVFGSHYRSKMDFSWESLASAQKNIDSIKQLLRQLPHGSGPPDDKILRRFTAALADDLNTPESLAVVMEYITEINAALSHGRPHDSYWPTLVEMDKVLGIIGPLDMELQSESVPEQVQALADRREAARNDNNFEKADELRIEIEKLGYQIEDTDSGPRIVKI